MKGAHDGIRPPVLTLVRRPHSCLWDGCHKTTTSTWANTCTVVSTLQAAIRAALREAGPLTDDELVAELARRRRPVTSKNPRQAVYNALTGDRACASTGDGRHCYLPTFIRGATVRLVMGLASPKRGLLAAGVEAVVALWPVGPWGDGTPRPATIVPDDGRPIEVPQGVHGWPIGLHAVLHLPGAFWRWWTAQQDAGADALLLYCEDGEAGRFMVRSEREAARDASAVSARNAEVRKAVASILGRIRSVHTVGLARRLLASGVYHGNVPPAPLSAALLEPPGPFTVEEDSVVYRPELTPALRSVLAHRLGGENWHQMALLHELLRLPVPRPPALENLPPKPRRQRVPESAYRLKVSLEWNKRVWRVVEILDAHTLDDLHHAIQTAFGWDDDHMYAFFLSGRAWDAAAEIVRPYRNVEPPTADEVTMADLELQPGRRFLYIFDFGDELRHTIEVLERFPASGRRERPRIVASHGAPPPQYSDGGL